MKAFTEYLALDPSIFIFSSRSEEVLPLVPLKVSFRSIMCYVYMFPKFTVEAWGAKAQGILSVKRTRNERHEVCFFSLKGYPN